MLRVAACLALLAATSLGACKSSGAAGKDDIKALAREWTLDWVQGTGPLPPGGRPPSLTIRPDGRVGGSTGVNHISATLDTAKLAHGGFSLSPIVTTEMAGPPEAMALESKFVDALQRARRYRIDGDQLVLADASGELLRFARGN